MTEAQAPTKLFREEAHTSSIKCLSCGGPIELHGFGATREVSCPYCGSVLTPDQSGALSVAAAAQRARRSSILPLHARGKLDGVTWEVIGIAWFACVVDGVEYPWQEFLLYNPYRGYRYLIYSMSDHHWSLGEALDGVPRAKDGAFTHRRVEWKGDRYRHFQTVVAHVTYVEGEYPWRVRAGDAVRAHEFVRPPESISVEEAQGEDGAGEINYTSLKYIDGRDVWKAFGQTGTPPRPSAIGSIQPNPHRRDSPVVWKSMLALLVLWAIASIAYLSTRGNTVVFEQSGLPLEPLSTEVEIGTPGKKGSIALTFSAEPLDNSWAYADVMLISREREEAIGFGIEADFYHGVSGGESWKEGTPRRTVVVGGVEGGPYLLQVNPQADKGTKRPQRMAVELRSDVGLKRYVVLPLVIILVFPLLHAFRGATFEGRRWQNSDHASG